MGFDIDTTHFNGEHAVHDKTITAGVNSLSQPSGNEAPEASVQAFYDPLSSDPDATDARVCGHLRAQSCLLNIAQWTEILPKVKLGPSSRHLFTIPNAPSATYVKLNMYPDGGIVSVYSVK